VAASALHRDQAVFLLVGSAAVHRRRARRRPPSVRHGPGYLPDVSVVIPAYNEAAGIGATIRSMVTSRYSGRIEVIGRRRRILRRHRGHRPQGLRIPYVRVISQPTPASRARSTGE